MPTSIHAEHYARIVERTATRRRLIDAAGQIAALAYQEADDVEEVVDHAEQILFGVSERRISRELVPIKQILSDYYDRIEYLTRHRGELIGIPTGFTDIDKLLGGLQRSDMIILAARPSVGKTSLALSYRPQRGQEVRAAGGLFQPGDVERAGGPAAHLGRDRHRLPASAPGRDRSRTSGAAS